jgi:formylglycine-generating enzyme required for sulfatase activity
MVLVRVEGQEPFLVDRYEVSVSELDRPGTGRNGPNRTAASGVTFAKAQEYARASGKDLPTIRQWFLAAFGDPEGRGRRFPWGDQPGSPGVHFVGGVDGPRAVDSCPAGASFAGCLNMAGNVMEWLGDAPRGRFVGGSFRRDQFTYTVQPKDESSGQQWEADFLRTPIPSYETWDAMPTAERERHWNFKAQEDGSTYAQVGLRCVVPLRRQP